MINAIVSVQDVAAAVTVVEFTAEVSVGGVRGPAAPLSDATPKPLGTPAAGVGGDAARWDHVHGMPTAADVGAIPDAPDDGGVYIRVNGEWQQMYAPDAGPLTGTERFAVLQGGENKGLPSSLLVEYISADLREGIADGMVLFSTKAAMNADLEHGPNTLARVFADTADKNGIYYKTGAIGAGAWVLSPDRVSAVELKAAATGMSYPTPSAINLDLDAGLLRIAASAVRVFYGRVSMILPAQDIALPGSRQRVEVNTSTGAVSFSSAASVPATNIVLGSYDHQEKKLIGFPPHFVNGVLLRTPSFGRTVVSAPAVITFDIAARQLVMTSCRIVTPEFSANVTATVPFPANGSAPYRLEWTPGAASPVSFVASSATLDPKKIVFGIVRIQASSVDVYGIDQYLVTGGSQPLPIYQGTLTGQAQYINFDFGAGFLRITTSGQVRAQYGRSVPTVPVQDVALPVALSTTWHKLLLNVDTRELSFLESYNALQPANSIIVGMVRVASQQVVGLLDYYVNGQPRSSGGGAALADREWIAVTGPTEPAFVVSPPLPDFKWVTSSPDYTAVYALYDALVTAYPDYVSRTLLGPDDAGNPIYRYDFTPPAVATGGPRIAKMILIAGIHGGERGGTMSLCFAMQQICNKWQTEPLLETLRWNCHFVVIPVASPWGFDNNGRKNENGVDLARNFPTLWSAGNSDPTSQQYRGPSPLSEKPTQYIDAIMSANRDAVYCGSFHNFTDPGPNNYFIWNASGTTFGMRLSQSLISKLSRAWKARYEWMPQDHATFLGYADLTTPVGSEGRHATTAYDIQGGTFEICGSLPLAPDPGQYSAEVATLGAETIVNWLLMNLEHGSDLYNGRGN